MSKRHNKHLRRIVPAATGSLHGGKATLSLCMIVRNEAANIAECLASIKPAVEEMIVVDTGSDDATAALAKAAGAKVFSFPWTGDFSAARNESIRHATGDYCLWLDADDRVDDYDVKKIRELKSRLPREKNCAYYLVVKNESAEDGNIFFSQLRIFPNILSARFEWPIHEQLYNNLKLSGVELEKTDIVVRHTGNYHAEDVVRKSKRNLDIIENALAKDPDNPVLHFQAARTLANLHRHDEAQARMRRVMEHTEVRHRHRQIYLEAGILRGRYLTEMGRTQEAETLLRELAQQFPNHPLVNFYLGENLVKNEKYAEAAEVLKKTFEAPLEVGFFPVNLNAMQFQQYFYLGVAYQNSGEFELAKTMLEKSLSINTDPLLSKQALALLALKSGQYASAIEYYEELAHSTSAQDMHFTNLGLAYRYLGQPGKAEANFLKALGLNPERVEALANLGHLYLRQKDYPKALNCFSQVERLQPGMPDIRLALSELHFRSQNFEALLKTCEPLLVSLSVDARRTLNDLKDLAGLYEAAGDTLVVQERLALAHMSYFVSVLIHPAVEVLRKAWPLAKEAEELPRLLDALQESLAHYPNAPEIWAPVQKFLEEMEYAQAPVRV